MVTSSSEAFHAVLAGVQEQAGLYPSGVGECTNLHGHFGESTGCYNS